jgi:hypothetical protein
MPYVLVIHILRRARSLHVLLASLAALLAATPALGGTFESPFDSSDEVSFEAAEVEVAGGAVRLRNADYGDGLLDGEEIELGTNVLLSDTDEDGLSDGEEVALGTDPLDPDSDDDGILDGPDGSGDLDGDGIMDALDAVDDRPVDPPYEEPVVVPGTDDGLSGAGPAWACSLGSSRVTRGGVVVGWLLAGLFGWRRRRGAHAGC